MKYCFYITDHGYGHATRNIAIMTRLSKIDMEAEFIVKSSEYICGFVNQNLFCHTDRITYCTDVHDVGIVLKDGTMEIDEKNTREQIAQDMASWDAYIDRECAFLEKQKPDIVVSDIVCWALEAAYRMAIPSLLISSFSWAGVYKSIFDDDVYIKYLNNYKRAKKAIWYEIHDKELESYVQDYKCVSLVSRSIDYAEAKRIKERHKRPIVFVSLGGSAKLDKEYDVSNLPYDFLVTKGITLRGDNVYQLPNNMINTPDYICASDYVISKGGWSTVAEILLQQKKCALLFRSSNREDDVTREYLQKRKHCVPVDGEKPLDINDIICRLENLKPQDYNYHDSGDEIAEEIISICKESKV